MADDDLEAIFNLIGKTKRVAETRDWSTLAYLLALAQIEIARMAAAAIAAVSIVPALEAVSASMKEPIALAML